MKAFKRKIIIGVLALASIGLFVSQMEARAQSPKDKKAGGIKTFRCVSTPEQATNPPLNHVQCTIYEMDSPIEAAYALGIIDYDYSVLSDTNDTLVMTVTMNGEEPYHVEVPTGPGEKCVVSVLPFSDNVVQQIFTGWYPRVENPKKVCRCINLYKESADNIQVGPFQQPSQIVDGLLQIGSAEEIAKLFP